MFPFSVVFAVIECVIVLLHSLLLNGLFTSYSIERYKLTSITEFNGPSFFITGG